MLESYDVTEDRYCRLHKRYAFGDIVHHYLASVILSTTFAVTWLGEATPLNECRCVRLLLLLLLLLLLRPVTVELRCARVSDLRSTTRPQFRHCRLINYYMKIFIHHTNGSVEIQQIHRKKS